MWFWPEAVTKWESHVDTRLKINFKLLHWQLSKCKPTIQQIHTHTFFDPLSFEKCVCAISISINTNLYMYSHTLNVAGWLTGGKKNLDGDKLLIQIKLNLTRDVRYFSHTMFYKNSCCIKWLVVFRINFVLIFKIREKITTWC